MNRWRWQDPLWLFLVMSACLFSLWWATQYGRP